MWWDKISYEKRIWNLDDIVGGLGLSREKMGLKFENVTIGGYFVKEPWVFASKYPLDKCPFAPSAKSVPSNLRLKGLILVVSDLTRAVSSNISSQCALANPPLTWFSQQVSALCHRARFHGQFSLFYCYLNRTISYLSSTSFHSLSHFKDFWKARFLLLAITDYDDYYDFGLLTSPDYLLGLWRSWLLLGVLCSPDVLDDRRNGPPRHRFHQPAQ